ncbi:MAG TPA: MFS transporter [Sphingopyxis sp.]|nr:MFS transporter [Sphingopyxis sp.]
MISGLNRLFRIEDGEWPKLIQFGFFGFLLQMGMGIGFSVGDAAFFSHVGAAGLPIIFILTPLVMLIYTGIFSLLMLRISLNSIVMLTLALLAGGGAIFCFLLDQGGGDPVIYYLLKLYLAMWYIALYTLFWTYTDAHFHIQDGKRLFPLFAGFCALGTASGALLVNMLAWALPMSAFLLIWAGLAVMTMPFVHFLGRRWAQIAEVDGVEADQPSGLKAQLQALVRAFRRSRFTMALAAMLFVTLLMTNLAEYQYASILEEGRSEVELAALFGGLYAISNIANLIICLFLFHRLVARLGVRNMAIILPLVYFAVFGYFFLSGGYAAALAAFFAYHVVLTSIEYNNQNLLFNAVPSAVKRPLRTVVEGMGEPLASLIAGGFLLYAAKYLDLRELSGIGVLLGAALIAIMLLLRQLYPQAMSLNMQQGWLNFNAPAPQLSVPQAARLQQAAEQQQGALARQVNELSGRAGAADASLSGENVDDIAAILSTAAQQSPRARRQIAEKLKAYGDAAIPYLVAALRDRRRSYVERPLAAQLLAGHSRPIFTAQADGLVPAELHAAQRWSEDAARLTASATAKDDAGAIALLGRAQRERAANAVDFVLELLALRGVLPHFDLLIVSLHSSNPKVRANAMEAIEAGAGHALHQQIGHVLQAGQDVSAPLSVDEVIQLASAALDEGSAFEQAAAIDVLAQNLSRADFARETARLITPAMPDEMRCQLLRHLGIVQTTQPDQVARVAALSRTASFSRASLQTLAELAGAATCQKPNEPAYCGHAGSQIFWISHGAIRDAAGRYPDLALAMLRMQKGGTIAT